MKIPPEVWEDDGHAIFLITEKEKTVIAELTGSANAAEETCVTPSA